MSVGDAHAAIDAAVQAVRDEYRADLDRLGDERDALVAQHDRDAAEIAELRGRVAVGAYTFDGYLQAKGLHDLLGVKGTESTVDAARRVVAERDEARQILALAEAVAAELPTPDATNPEHLRWVANLLGSLPGLPTGIQGCAQTWGSREVARSPQDVRVVADRLEAAHQQADANEELIEKAAAVIACECTDRGAARALLAAGLLAAADAAERGES